MTDFYFNKKDFNKLLDITSTLNDLARAKGIESFVVFDDESMSAHSYTHKDIVNLVDNIFDKEPDSDWDSRYEDEWYIR